MKRMLALLLAVMMLSGLSAAGSAESYDLSELSDNALVKLYELLQQEMKSRGLLGAKSYDLPAGKYIVGEDILPGKYTLTCTATSGEELGNAYSSLGGITGNLGEEDGTDYGSLFGSLGSMMGDLVAAQIKIVGDYGTVIKSCELKKDQKIRITLEERTALQIEDGSCTLSPEE